MTAATRAPRAFGLRLTSHVPVPELPAVAIHRSDPDVELVVVDRADVERAWSGPTDPPWIKVRSLGTSQTYTVERGRGGDMRIERAGEDTFLLEPGTHRIRCAPADISGIDWRRFLLDTVLGTAALAHGMEALHASAYLRPEGVVGILAGQGGGKSTLLAELLRRGRPLFCDDLLMLSDRDGELLAHPGPPVVNLPPELPDGSPVDVLGRELGLVDGECWLAVEDAAVDSAPVAAVALLERGHGGAVTVERLAPSPVPLLRHSLMSGDAPARLERRFAVCAEWAATVPLLQLRGPADAPPGRYADTLEDAVTRVHDMVAT